MLPRRSYHLPLLALERGCYLGAATTCPCWPWKEDATSEELPLALAGLGKRMLPRSSYHLPLLALERGCYLGGATTCPCWPWKEDATSEQLPLALAGLGKRMLNLPHNFLHSEVII
ncbi:hypothetical protein CesoFtcFv8_000183 [Champsocephalus esox]|uniref:Uncharacterized protein n=1 Tax=Champsocephalus esox TaxID=159716 RepID=A0AAN8HXL5_9TELE|nr:hypothetical protein CesoFtcFv8_000183 [Champsocephalus esox]